MREDDRLADRRVRQDRLGLKAFGPDVVDRLRAHLPNETREVVMGTLGMSQPTWWKLKRGEPVRSILVERALQRVEPDTTRPRS